MNIDEYKQKRVTRKSLFFVGRDDPKKRLIACVLALLNVYLTVYLHFYAIARLFERMYSSTIARC